jgi:hypothetical protein
MVWSNGKKRGRVWAYALTLLVFATVIFADAPAPALAADARYTVYYEFSMPNETYLVPVTALRSFAPSPAEGVISALIDGPPATEGLPYRTLIPKGTRLLGVEMKGDIAYVNFSKEITSANVGSRGDALLVASIVNSLCTIPGVNRVQILVDGSKVETLAGHVYVGEPLKQSDAVVFKGFKDVKGTWAEGQILAFALRGVIAGYPGGAFKPNANITRAEFLKMLCATLDVSPLDTKTQSFRDVPKTHWAHPWVESAVKAGFLKPADYSGGLLKPDNAMPRKEMAVLLARGSDLEGDAKREAGALLPFTDTVAQAGWLKGYIKVVVDEGLLKGYPDLTFRPEGLLTRAETATVMARLAGMSRPDPGTGRPDPGTAGSPCIYLAYPKKGKEINTPFFVAGTAQVFEGNVEFEMGYYTGKKEDGKDQRRKTLKEAFLSASEGAPSWGIFAGVIPYEPPWAVGGWKSEDGYIEAYYRDARDGTKKEVFEIPITVIGQ